MPTASAPLAAVRTRLVDLLWQGVLLGRPSADTDADRILASLVTEGNTAYWPDIDYADLERSAWKAAAHYTRLESVLVAAGRDRLREDEAYRRTALAVLRYWLVQDFRNPNWWHNEIGMPRHIADLSLLLWDYMPASDREMALTLIGRGSMKCAPKITGWTGANLIWGIQNTVKHALLSQDGDLLLLALSRASKEIDYGEEGIQPDGAFRQHGPRWYSGGYGASFTYDLSMLIYVLDGSPYQFSEDKIRMFLLHVLDGQRVMMKNGYFDYCGVGREFSRHGVPYMAGLRVAVGLLASMDSIPRREELAAFALECAHPAEVDASADSDRTVYYPSVALLCHRKAGSYIGVKGHGPDLYDAEVCNDEGVLMYNMSYGTHTCLMRRGDEYHNVSPLWDYAHIPGTTAAYETDSELLSHGYWWNQPLPTDHLAACAEDEMGVLLQRADHDGITAFVSFFTFEGCLVAMGAGISDEKGRALCTTLDQAYAVSPDLSALPRRVDNGEWSYVALADTELLAEAGTVTGAWSRNNLPSSAEPVEGALCTVSVAHSDKMDHYAYLIAPRGADLPSIRILSNTAALQAISVSSKGEETVLAAFHEAGILDVGEGKKVDGQAKTCKICHI